MPIFPTLSFGSSTAEKVTSILSDFKSSFESTFKTTFKKRNAVVIRIIQGHRLATITLKVPTYCSQCRDFIWGFNGFSCKLCKLSCHQKCLTAIQSTCVKSLHNRQANLKQHQFKPEKFSPLQPAYCNHCGTLICSLTKIHQGLICSSCHIPVHYDCQRLVCSDCQPTAGKANNLAQPEEPLHQSIFNHKSKMSIDQFELLKLIGTGSFSKVYLAKYGQQQFAIKVIKKTNPVVSSDPASVFNEFKTLNLGRRYPFLATAHCCFQSEGRLYLVMEHVVGRDLVYYLTKTRKFTEDRTRFHAAEIVLALIFLHNNSIIYRDLKLDNVILDKDGHCKLIDFGMSKRLSPEMDNNKTRTFCGTPNYISPEIIRELAYDYSADWWSLGVLIYEMLVGCSPFDTCEGGEDEIYRLILNQEVSYPVHLSTEARSLLEGLLTKDPRHRLGCQIIEDGHKAITRHPFFQFNEPPGASKAFQWQAIEAKRMTPPYRPTAADLRGDNETLDNLRIQLSPIGSNQLQKIAQQDFDGFSSYSESFASLANISTEQKNDQSPREYNDLTFGTLVMKNHLQIE